MRAVVLVGGVGTRLQPLTLATPKQMLPVGEMTMIERVVAHLARHGVDAAVLSMGYRPDAFLTAFPDDRCAGVSLSYAIEDSPLDTGGAIGFAAREADVDDTFLVVNGDVLTDLDIGALVAFHRRRRAEATISLTPVQDPSSFGVVVTDGDGKVDSFVEKPPPGTAPTNLINAGTYVLEPSVLERIPGTEALSIERKVFPDLAERGTLYAMASDDYWIDAGTPATYLRANLDLLAGLRRMPPNPHARQVRPGVWTIRHPVVGSGVAERALIGDAAYVRAGSRVRDSVVGAGARVESATVTGSVVLPGAVVHPGALVERSIVGAAAVIGNRARVTGLSVIGDGAKVEPDARLEACLHPAP
ncbi:MAG TPA: NDP-sugar synthase [Acidimicrobiales bacterium]|nr:NDP-sugar synthase [Acidimicrobiales bacterium]